MKSLRFLSVILGLSLASMIYSCDKVTDPGGSSSSSAGDCPNGRSGAVCKDGTTSTATGSGACSSHGGVDRWICK